MKKLVFLFAAFLLVSHLYAQNPNQHTIDSLLVLTGKSKDRQQLFDLNSAIGKLYFQGYDYDKSIAINKKNLMLAKAMKSKKNTAMSYKNLTLVYINKTEMDSAIQTNDKAIALFREIDDQETVAKSLLYYSIIYQNKSDFIKQADYAFQSLKIAEKIKDTLLLEGNNRNLAMLYLDQKDYKKALRYASASLKYAKMSGNPNKIGEAYSALAETYNMMDDKPKARDYFKAAMSRFTDDYAGGKAWVLTNWANVIDNPKSELKMRLEAQSYWEIIGPDNIMSMNNLGNLGRLYYDKYQSQPTDKMGNLAAAEKYLRRSLAISAKSSNVQNYTEFLHQLAQVEADKGDYKNAFAHVSEYHHLQDSLYSQDNKNKIAAIENQKAIDIKNKEIKLNKLIIESKEKQKWFYILGIVALLVIAGIIFRNSRKLQQLNGELDEANKIKMRFFSILNHDLRSPVSSLISFLHLQKESPELLDEESRARMENKTITSAENLLESMEDILLWSKGQMENFRPQPKNIAVNSLFHDLQKHFSATENVQINFTNPENLELFTDENYTKTILRNLAGNAIKALEKTENAVVLLNAFSKDGHHFISVTDNGPGGTQEQFRALYDEKEVVGIKSGLGLHLIRDLAKAINCKIEVETNPGSGTTFLLKFG